MTDHRFLGGAGRWRDSGMMGEPTNDNPACFWQADLAEATRDLVAVMRETRPQVVITYDENGSYGHPDHIQAHRVTVAALDVGIKANTPRMMSERGIEIHVLPASATIDDVLAVSPEGLFFSNGPGDPAATNGKV